ncbi:MAG: Gfo/Idh/MocA family oxidoreductase [Anaerolineae bacterium]|nr:Gfo/Idh/MocA family oxidoreductase [Anaerolineae bacterium]
MKKLRWGLLSTARINRALIKPIRASRRNELVAVASRTLEKAQTYADEWEIPRVFGSYEAMLADPDIDVIYNSLPNSMHAEWTIKAAEAGKHVLCEKPLAITVGEVDAILAAGEEAGVTIMEAFMYRHHPQNEKIKELINKGAIGELRLIRGSFSFNLDSPNNIRLDPALGGGSLWDIGCYPISFARMIADAEPIEAFGWQITGASGVDETFTGQLRFPDDLYLQLDCSFQTPYRVHMEIVGSENAIIVPQPYKPGSKEKIFLGDGNKKKKISMPGEGLYRGQVENMADVILDNKALCVSLSDSRNNIAAIKALLQSAREGKVISI